MSCFLAGADIFCSPLAFVFETFCSRYLLFPIPFVSDIFCSWYLLYLIPFVSDTFCDDTFCVDTFCADTFCTRIQIFIVLAKFYCFRRINTFTDFSSCSRYRLMDCVHWLSPIFCGSDGLILVQTDWYLFRRIKSGSDGLILLQRDLCWLTEIRTGSERIWQVLEKKKK